MFWFQILNFPKFRINLAFYLKAEALIFSYINSESKRGIRNITDQERTEKEFKEKKVIKVLLLESELFNFLNVQIFSNSDLVY